MRVVIASYFFSKTVKTEEELLELHYTTTGWAEALQRMGMEVIVINRFHKNSSVKKNNVLYLFYCDHLGESFRAWQFPIVFFRKIKELHPDILHLHHLTLSLQTLFLRLLLPVKTVIVVQHHGGKSPLAFKRRIHNLFNLAADGFFFTAKEQGLEWFMKKSSFPKILPVMEGATFFNYAERDHSRKPVYSRRTAHRQLTNMHGNPVFLWVGRLDYNKDPLTVLQGFKSICKKYPTAKLYMIYSDRDLEHEVLKQINGDNILHENVKLLGSILHDEIEAFYQSADYFVLGSHYEGSGYALSEALRCGCIPIVTNIPSFTMMTDGGRRGALWQPGDKDSFVEAVTIAVSKPLYDEAMACIDFYEKKLSFNAIAETAIQHYYELSDRKQGVKKTTSIATNA